MKIKDEILEKDKIRKELEAYKEMWGEFKFKEGDFPIDDYGRFDIADQMNFYEQKYLGCVGKKKPLPDVESYGATSYEESLD